MLQTQYSASAILEILTRMSKSPLFVGFKSSKLEEKLPPVSIQVILNPLSKSAQQLSAILLHLCNHLHVDVEVLLNPERQYSEMPLKAFYRYVLQEPSSSGMNEEFEDSAVAEFSSLPIHDTLTLGMDVPEMWMVSAWESEHDLDNIRLENLPANKKSVTASFRLDSILITGMCVDITALESGRQAKIHPRGVQLTLGTEKVRTMVDTLVMSNLGYFQLKAVPGMWKLRLADGPSREIYSIESARGKGHFTSMKSAGSISEGAVEIPIASFAGEDLFLLLRPNPGQEDRDVLDLKENALKKSSQGNDVIHVFTVASGHMYERLQKIMILSATKRSSLKIKFWFIENYMSPQMKKFVPLMADQYGFDFEYVS